MNISKLVPLAVTLAFLTSIKMGSLVSATNFIRHAQMQLIQDSKASKWPKAMLLPARVKKYH